MNRLSRRARWSGAHGASIRGDLPPAAAVSSATPPLPALQGPPWPLPSSPRPSRAQPGRAVSVDVPEHGMEVPDQASAISRSPCRISSSAALPSLISVAVRSGAGPAGQLGTCSRQAAAQQHPPPRRACRLVASGPYGGSGQGGMGAPGSVRSVARSHWAHDGVAMSDENLFTKL